jgi:flagellar motor protein MotB
VGSLGFSAGIVEAESKSMSRRSNPWPAFADLFAALLVAAFAGFILIASELKGAGKRLADLETKVEIYERRERELSRIRAEADRIAGDLEARLAEDQRLRGKVTKCGDDACLDLFIHFRRNEAQISEDQQFQVGALQEACHTLRRALDRLPPAQRRDIEVIVEGHADRTQVSRVTDPRVAFLFNWYLSSQRAASVLYEFQRCGLTPPTYGIAMIGYADSDQICTQPTESCDQENRRTTLRLRADTRKIAKRLEATTIRGAAE